VERFIVGIVVRIGLLEKVGPNLHDSILIYLFAVDKIGLHFALAVLEDRNKIIHNYVLPHILLEDLDQVHPKLIDLKEFEHLRKNGFAVFDATKCVSYKTASSMLAFDCNVAPLVLTHHSDRRILVKLSNPHPLELLALRLL
jgi:hypothetical protein